jgi:hypothetical protein
MFKVFKDKSGEVFGRLTVVSCTQKCNKSQDVHSTKYLCLCSCGNEKVVASSSLSSGATKSCGCISKEKSRAQFTTHGGSKTSTYNSWRAMRERCNDPNNKRYNNYGGIGIGVCVEWESSFEKFREDMGERPENRTLDRINPKLDYSKDNCRWATKSTQAFNKNKESLGSSKRVGVSYHKRSGKWQVRIRHNQKEVHLGYFHSEDIAIRVREEAEILYRGENLK